MDTTGRKAAYIFLCLLGSGSLLACGDDTESQSDVTVVDGSDGSGTVDADTGSALPPCTDNIDCRGGEVCRDGLCREACGTDDSCSGPLPVCDVERGFCVGCIDDAQCTTGLCDVDAGVCVDAECGADADCRGGERCSGGRCVSIDEQVCEPGETECDGDTLVTCSRDGTRLERSPCADPFWCEVRDDGAACVREICEPDEIGCLDTTTAYVCDSSGTGRTELPCGDGDVCDAGVCRPGICEGGTTRCESDALIICDELGTRETVIDCGNTTDCLDSEAGCTCADGECTPRLCLPGARECAGNGTRECAADGLAWEGIVPCDVDEVCIEGLCLETSCEPGASLCASNTLLVCNGPGTGYQQTDCADAGDVCVSDGDGAACADRVCDPGTSTCTPDGSARRLCNALGTAWQEFDCGLDLVCSSGACVERVCDPGDRRCAAGNAEECNALGTGFVRVESCGAGEVCADGYCEPSGTGCRSGADCPAPAAFCDGSTFVEYAANGTCAGGVCNYGAVERRTNCAETGRTCTAGGCQGDVECATNDDCGGIWTSGFCVDSVCVDCRNDFDCDTTAYCSDGTCLPLDEADCLSDAECVALAESLGTAEPDARCLVGVGCYVPGACNQIGDATPPDPFGAACPGDLTCLPLLAGLLENGVCTGCADNTDCRPGESCKAPLFFGSNYCDGATSPLPF